jgi:type I restriction enzyme S subunit
MQRVPIAQVAGEPSTWNPKGSVSDEPFRYIDISSIDPGEKRLSNVVTIAPSEAPSRARQLVRSGDVLVSTVRPNLNAVAVVTDDLDGATASTGFAVLRPDRASLDPRYLYYWVRSPKFVREMTSRATGASYPAVTERVVRDSRLPLPPLAEQRRIAAVLDKADGIRRKRRESLRLLDEFLRSAFLEMFGDPVRNEKGWEVVWLGELLDGIDSGWSPTCLARPAGEGEWGVLKLGAVTTCEYLERENKALKESTRPRPDLEVRAGDILVTRKNTSELVAACAYVSSTRERLMLPDLVYRLRLKERAPVVPTYLWQVLIHPGKRRQVQLLARGSAGSMPNISKGRLAAVAVPMPPIELQRRFGSVIAKAERLKATLRNQSACDTKLFDSVAQRAFRGEL